MQNQLTRDQEIQQIELTIGQARKFIAIGDALTRLEKNEDFKKLIFNEYFVEEAARFTSLLAEPAMQRPDQQSALFNSLRAISELKQWLLTTKMKHEQFVHELQANQELLDEIRSELGTETEEA